MPKVKLDDSFFRYNYNTVLSPEQEQGFNQWISAVSKQKGYDASLDMIDYDMKGAYAAGLAQAPNGHLPDTYKKPNHPTFSDQSQYSGALGPNGEKFKGGTWGDDYYAPSKEMMDYTHNPEDMKRYMDKTEPGYHLVLPQ